METNTGKVYFSAANNPDTWITDDWGIIRFPDNAEAKKAEQLFNSMQGRSDQLSADNAALRSRVAELEAALLDVLAGNLEQTAVSGAGGYLTVSGDCMRRARAALANNGR